MEAEKPVRFILFGATLEIETRTSLMLDKCSAASMFSTLFYVFILRQSCEVARAGFELVILQPQPLK